MGTTTRPPRAAPGFPRPRSGVRNGPHRASRGPFPTARGERFENSPGPAASASKIYRRLRRAHRKSPTTRPGRVGICRRLHGTLRKSTGACAGLSNPRREANSRTDTPESAGRHETAESPPSAPDTSGEDAADDGQRPKTNRENPPPGTSGPDAADDRQRPQKNRENHTRWPLASSPCTSST
jgi:hypothetical protein